jgi:hypothetical protein
VYKKKVQVDREGLALDSTDIWTKGPIQKYEERPAEVEDTCLADFLAWYTPKNAKRPRRTLVEDSDYNEDEEQETNANTRYKKRDRTPVLRWRSYISDVKNHKREMVLLYVPFRNVALDLNDCDRYVNISDENENSILTKRKHYERDVTIQYLIHKLKCLREYGDEYTKVIEDDVGLRRDVEEIDADILSIPSFGGMAIVRKREGVMM